MGASCRPVASVLCWLLVITGALTKHTVLDYVDPLIGTTNGGHVFAGATLPFSMAKAVADSTKDHQGGFASNDSPISGFSHMHDSGTGGSLSLGGFPLFPRAGCPNDDISQCTFPKRERVTKRKKGSETASPGYFAITLDTDVHAEMTVTNHTALYRFTFPDTPMEKNATLRPLITQDVTDLSDPGWDVEYEVDSSSGRIQGNATYNPSFGLRNYNLKICTDFKGAKILETSLYPNGKDPRGAYVQFDKPKKNNQILVRAGVSFISTAQACQNAETEIPDFDFEKVHQAAVDAWTKKLEPIEVKTKGVSTEYQTIFWSGIYRTMISPQDYTNENPLWKSSEPYYDSYYCIWDSFRTIHPLLILLDPLSQTRMVRSLIDIYRHEGYLPDCRMSLCPGYTQGGSNADVVLADSWMKGISDPDLNWTTGFKAAVKDAEVPTKNWDVVGRGGLPSWKKIGFIPLDEPEFGRGHHTRSISRTVEYAYDDFCIAKMAEEFGTQAQVKKYRKRAGNWESLYRADQTDSGFTGFLQPRYSDGGWGFQDPTLCSPLNNIDGCYLNSNGHETYEGSCWLYTFFVPQDMASLIKKLGGPANFTERLDYFHESGLLYMGDEQSFLNIFLYHYSGRPALSAKRIHYYIPSEWNTTVAGIPGNDDAGAMGSAAAFMMMGFFPNAGQDVYLITPPFFPEVSIRNPQTGNTATIRNVNFDADYQNIYIQKATLNGRDYRWSWLTHRFFLEGGVLELTLGDTESSWGTAPEDLPPSMSVKRTSPGPESAWSSSSSVERSSFSTVTFASIAIFAVGVIAYFYRRRRAGQKYRSVPEGDPLAQDVELDTDPLTRSFAIDDDVDDVEADTGLVARYEDDESRSPP